MEVLIEKSKQEDLMAAINIYDKNHSTTTDYNKLLTVYNEIYNNSAYHNIVAQSFYEKLGYIKEVGYVKLIDKQKW